MNIITGSARGTKLLTLEGEATRPTLQRAKEVIFSAIQFDIEGREVLDLFAGSGQLGLEALSRGASRAVLVDRSAEAFDVIKANAQKTHLYKNCRIVNSDYAEYLRGAKRSGAKFGLVFIDPPYQSGLVWHALSKAAEVTNPGGTIICEHPANEKAPQESGNFSIYRQYQYGKVGLTFYRRKEMAETV